MALLEQNFNFISIYTGFHGSCDDEPCVPFDLRDNPHKDMIKLVTQTHFGRTSDVTFKPEVEDNQYVTNDFVMIECGKIYKIYLKPGQGSFQIPGFVVTDAATTEERYVTDVCGVGPQPITVPTISADDATNVGQNSADISGSVVDDGGEAPTITAYWGTWDGSLTGDSWESEANLGSFATNDAFFKTVTIPNKNTLYYFTFKAENSAGVVWSTPKTFTTLSPVPPNIALLDPSNLTWEYFTINWNLISYEGSDEPELTLFWGEEDMGSEENDWDEEQDLGQNSVGLGSFKLTTAANQFTFYTIRATNSQGETWTDVRQYVPPLLEVEESSVLIMTPDVQHRQELQFTINGLHGNEQKIRVYWSYRSNPANHDGGNTSAGVAGWEYMAEYPTGPGQWMPNTSNLVRNPDGVWTESVVTPSSTTYTYTIDYVDSEHAANQTWMTGNPPGPNLNQGFKDTIYWKVKIYGELDTTYRWLDTQSYVQESSCSVNIGAANNANFPSTAPAKHRAGGSFNWCAGTEYADPGVRQPYPVDCHGDEVEIEVQYWDNQSYVVWHDDPSTAANSHQITNPTEIAKLGLDTIITCDDGTTLGPAPYSFAVFYIATSPLTGGRDTSGRSMWVWNDGDTSQPNWPDYDPCVSSDCCSNLLPSTNVVAEQVTEFGSPRVVVSGFSYSGELCCGNGSVGTPNSVNLYVNGYAPSVGLISFAGELDSSEIYLKVTDDPFEASGVPAMTGECLKGIVNGDECILEIQ